MSAWAYTEPITDDEVSALVRRAVDRVLANAIDSGWVGWEDIPELGEYDWERVAEAFDAWVADIAEAHDRADELDEVDRRELWERFQ